MKRPEFDVDGLLIDLRKILDFMFDGGDKAIMQNRMCGHELKVYWVNQILRIDVTEYNTDQ